MGSKRLSREKRTIFLMIRMYCRSVHNRDICSDCNQLLNYAMERIKHCPFGETKPACTECKIHCYNRYYREEIKKVMRFSGPKMIFRYPLPGIMHFVDKYLYRGGRKPE